MGSPAEGSEEAEHPGDPSDPLRRVDAGTGESIAAHGESLSDMGRVGRRGIGA